MSTSTGASLTAQLGQLAQLAHRAAGGADPGDGDPVVLAGRDDATVVRSGAVVAKAHDSGGDPAPLAARLRVAAHPLLRGVLLAPLPLPRPVPPPRAGTGRGSGREPGGPLLGTLPGGRRISLWPYGTPVDPGAPGAAPWEAAGALLARLHSVPLAGLPGPLPPMRGPARVVRALELLRREVPRTAAARTVAAAGETLPAWALGAAPPPRDDALCHGDLHLGQLVRYPAPGGPWHLIDVDDLGPGDPAWDLARPAAWFAAGLLPPADFGRFLTAYRTAGGPAVPGDGPDPWPWLDIPARALTVQTAARSLARAAAEERAPDETDRALVEACSRIVRSPAGPGPYAGRGRTAPGYGG
ncbi:aminoglycoside phosphotransferase [Streptomyces carminius]|uniref:Aminoglycoside phosphotransferase n=1 Tax=Streptomyces carminius TaxID=2665496 RepID=A0A2M8LSS9_9ACTN|nr:aminoglycoside phosphotransferase family protein [Streptomyces carminius]PJE94998.1 aminoglycoside phosphotransferase [Streptomyces carminius]